MSIDYKEYPILYVDDDEQNLIVMKHNLGQFFTIRLVNSAEEALKVLDSEFIAVLLADQRMPIQTGVDLAEQCLKLHPQVVRVIITAYSDLEATIDAINRGRVSRFLKKPWSREEVIAVMQESICSYVNTQLLRQMQDKLMEQDRIAVVGIIASSFAHDIKQPGTVIFSTLDFLRMEIHELIRSITVDPPLKIEMKKVNFIRDSLSNLTAATERLLELSSSLAKMVSGQKQQHEMVDVKKVIFGVISIFRSTIVSRARLFVDLPEADVYVWGSSSRLSQLLSNLLLNAAQAITQGSAFSNQIGVRLTTTEETHVLEVTDTGIGIPPEIQDKVFRPLFTTKGSKGSGLGLAICKQIVEEMDGTIGFTSVPEKGTCFTVVLKRPRLANNI